MNDRVPLSELTKEEKPAEEPKGHEGVWRETTSFLDNIDYHEMADFFDIGYEDRRNEMVANKLSYLTDWITDTQKIEDKTKIKFALHQIAKGLGLPMKGKELVDNLYKWARLDVEHKVIEDKMKLIMAKGESYGI
jgi:hypothetical protein